jgi:hypothetical protein
MKTHRRDACATQKTEMQKGNPLCRASPDISPRGREERQRRGGDDGVVRKEGAPVWRPVPPKAVRAEEETHRRDACATQKTEMQKGDPLCRRFASTSLPEGERKGRDGEMMTES